MPVAYNQSGEYIIFLLFPYTQEAILASIMEHQAHIFCFVTLTLLLFGVLNFPLCPHSSNRGNYTTHRKHAVFSHPSRNATMVILESGTAQSRDSHPRIWGIQLLLAWEKAQ